MEEGENSLHRHSQNQETIVRPIQGMESVVATVSGYHGLERFKLIKLIDHAGANYTGRMSSENTHLVCWKFEGRKYDLAKKFRTLIVNHRWVEECIKQGKRVPEHPFILHSGLEVGSLLLEVPTIKVGISHKGDKLLSNQSNVHNCHEKEINDIGLGGSSNAVWTDSCLLKENSFLDAGKSNDKFQKSKRKRKSSRISEQEALSSGKFCFQEPPLSGPDSLDILEEEASSHFSANLRKDKRKISNTKKNNHLAESSKGRKLVKKNVVGRDRLQSLSSDSDHEIGHSNGTRNIKIFGNKGRSEGCCSYLQIESEDEGVEEIMNWNHVPDSRGSNICHENMSVTLERPLQDGVADVENLKCDNDDGGQLEAVNISHTAVELSCVICWTDFSSTRGVLPCGHRFCYSCIQNWADHMVARGRISTCPLCKANFTSIKKVEGAVTSDQKIYSQTVPHSPSTMDIFIPIDRGTFGFGAQSSRASVCSECHSREPEDCLVSCRVCQIHCIHSYCLDPPLLPWTCTNCKDLRMLFRNIH